MPSSDDLFLNYIIFAALVFIAAMLGFYVVINRDSRNVSINELHLFSDQNLMLVMIGLIFLAVVGVSL